MIDLISSSISRRNILRSTLAGAVGLALPGLNLQLGLGVANGSFDARFVHFFPMVSADEIQRLYSRIYDIAKLESITNEYVKSGGILKSTYFANSKFDVTTYRFASEKAFLSWDHSLFINKTYRHNEFLASGFKTWSNIPNRLIKNDFYSV